ncbi:hypothetical protein [Parabacteroides sp. Marseille-P3160]|uniref:hypothetical protein n=1 Tax=Parabacteroides sp. Marseille-P3160 TaxID=1917887 RepID=UPI0009BB4B42|nr:hypothetical protein [Parabacteroides sp. Marseille-P3160]
MSENEIAKLDTDKIAASLFPGVEIPKFILRILCKIAHVDDINELFAGAPGKKDIDFVDASMKYFNISCRVAGAERLPAGDRPLIFVSNHPLGALEAISIAHILGHRYNGKIKFYANEFLRHIEPLKDLFLPIYKRRHQSRENIRLIQEFYESAQHLISFPAGITSRLHGKKIVDVDWHGNFIKKAVEYKRDVVPLYFEARNSSFYYRLERFRMLIRSRISFETLFLPNEMFKQRGKIFTLYIGDPIPWQTFNSSRTSQGWAAYVKEIAYRLPPDA